MDYVKCSSLELCIFRLMGKRSKRKFGTLLDRKDTEPLLLRKLILLKYGRREALANRNF